MVLAAKNSAAVGLSGGVAGLAGGIALARKAALWKSRSSRALAERVALALARALA